MRAVTGCFTWIYNLIVWLITFVGLVVWILMLPFILAIIYATFEMALETPDPRYNLTMSGISTDVVAIAVVILLILIGPFSVIRLIKAERIPGCLYSIARLVTHPARWIIRLYAFIAGFSAVMAVGLKFAYPELERMDSLAIIFGTMFTAFIGYARTINREIKRRDSGIKEKNEYTVDADDFEL